MRPQQTLLSIGHAAGLLQMLPGEIQERAARLGIAPTLRINAIDHYTEGDIDRIRRARQDENPLTGGQRGPTELY